MNRHDIAYVKDCIEVDSNGVITWKKRPESHFLHPIAAKRWNGKWAGKLAGSIMPYGYLYSSINKKKYLHHVLVWVLTYGEWPEGYIDHIDGNPTNNKVENLRCVTHQENLKNQRKKCNNTSGCSGLYWDKKQNSWYVQIMVWGEKKNFGRFKNKEQAISARNKAYKDLGFTERHGV